MRVLCTNLIAKILMMSIRRSLYASMAHVSMQAPSQN